MTNFKCKIANQVIDITAIYESTKEYCRNYITGEPASFAVTVTPEDIAKERIFAAREDEVEGLPVRNLSDVFLERTALQRKITEHLFARNVLLFHGSVVAVDGRAYLFTAKSGTGKSTHTGFWRRILSDRAVMVNDDKPFLEIGKDVVMAYGSPWMGKHGLGQNISLPLEAICILERGEKNEILPIKAKEALKMLLQQSCRPADGGKMMKYLELLDGISKKVKFYRLRCNMEPEAAIVAYEAMSGQKYEGDWND